MKNWHAVGLALALIGAGVLYGVGQTVTTNGCVYLVSPPVPVDRQTLPYFCDSTGRVRMAGLGSTFTPTSLFMSGEMGGWWDPSDMTTMFLDTAGTMPVTVAGQSVARINDKSGNGNNLLQATAADRPILHNSGSLWWLEFDGVAMQLQALFTITQPMSRVMAAQWITYSANGGFWDGSTHAIAALYQFSNTPPEVQMYGGGSGPTDSSNMTRGVNHVVSEVWNGASPSTTLQIDNNAVITGLSVTGAIGGLTVGSDVGFYTNMQFYGGVTISRLLTTTETNNSRTFFGAKAGLTL